jgi:hypothetical protein
MAITIETLNIGDTNYVSKHNANNSAIKTAVDALQLALSGSVGSVVNFPAAMQEVFGITVARMSETDSVGTDGGSALLNIAAGTIWIPSAAQVRSHGATSLDFTGFATDTYYTHVDGTGAYTVDTTATDAVHTISFTSPSTFTTITDPAVVWGYDIFQAAKTSTVLGSQTFEELDGRLEAAEGASTSIHPVTITVSDVTLTTAEGMNHAIFNCTGTLTGNRNLIVPNFEKPYIILNNTAGAFTLTVKTSAGTGIVVTQGSGALLYCDATNVETAVQAAPSTQPYVLGSWKNGSPTATERVLGHVFPSGVSGITLAASATGSNAEAETAATAQTDFDLHKNGSSIGTIRFAALGTVATFVSISETTFTGGDLLEILAPGTPDSTLAELYFTLYFTRDI